MRFKDYTPVIPKSALVHGAYYLGRCRHATVARWNASTQRFYHWRVKFGAKFVELICAPEDDSHFDVFVTKERIADLTATEKIPFPEENEDEDVGLRKTSGSAGEDAGVDVPAKKKAFAWAEKP